MKAASSSVRSLEASKSRAWWTRVVMRAEIGGARGGGGAENVIGGRAGISTSICVWISERCDDALFLESK